MSSTSTNLKGYSFVLAYIFQYNFIHLSSWKQFNPVFANNKSCEKMPVLAPVQVLDGKTPAMMK